MSRGSSGFGCGLNISADGERFGNATGLLEKGRPVLNPGRIAHTS